MKPKLPPSHCRRLKRCLELLYGSHDFWERVSHDPILVPKGYKEKEDIEAAGFIASCLAYGRVEQFLPVIRRILSPMGASPYAFIREFDARKKAALFQGIKYRFNETEDIVCLIHVLGALLNKFESIEGSYLNHYIGEDLHVGNAMAEVAKEALSVDTTPVYGKNVRPQGFRFFFPSPASGSACKRTNLFLRWMVRRADIDFGIWRGIAPDKLVIPLDTHIARVSRCLGLTARKTDGWKTALEITASLRVLDSEDPLKYDFALCHRGISGLCRGTGSIFCEECDLEAFRQVA